MVAKSQLPLTCMHIYVYSYEKMDADARENYYFQNSIDNYYSFGKDLCVMMAIVNAYLFIEGISRIISLKKEKKATKNTKNVAVYLSLEEIGFTKL